MDTNIGYDKQLETLLIAAENKAKAINRQLQIDYLLEDIEFKACEKEDTEEWKEYTELLYTICGLPGISGSSNYNPYMDWKNKNDSRIRKNQEKYRRKFFKR